MRYHEITEQTIRIPDETGIFHIVTKNPTKAQFHKMTAETCDYRGLVTKNDLYMWAGWHATHNQITHKLGLEDAIRVFINRGGVIRSFYGYWGEIKASKYIQYLFGDRGPDLEEE